MIWTAFSLCGWTVEVDDRLLLDDVEARVRILDSAGAVVRFWRVSIESGAPGLPVWIESSADGRRRCFGGPSHPELLMARVRAAQALEGVVEQAVGSLQGLILEARERADGAGGR
jgi:hypothetical protein